MVTCPTNAGLVTPAHGVDTPNLLNRTQLAVESASRSLVWGCRDMGTRAQIDVNGAQAAGDREAGNGPESHIPSLPRR